MLRCSVLLVALCALPASAYAQSCTVTRQVYHSIRTQSTLSQVVSAIGCSGTVIFEGPGPTGKPSKTVTWPGTKPGKLARLTFEDDRLMIKSENGLE